MFKKIYGERERECVCVKAEATRYTGVSGLGTAARDAQGCLQSCCTGVRMGQTPNPKPSRRKDSTGLTSGGLLAASWSKSKEPLTFRRLPKKPARFFGEKNLAFGLKLGPVIGR